MRQLKIESARCNAGQDCDHECEEACAAKVFKLDGRAFAALHIEGPTAKAPPSSATSAAIA